MTEASQPSTSDPLGPVDFIVVEFPDGLVTSTGFNELLELSQRGVIKVLDLEFVICDADGARLATPSELDPAPQIDIDIWQGASSGLLDADDVAMIGAELSIGAVAVVVVYENRWVLGLVERWSATGARLLLDGGVPTADLVDALDTTETA